MMESLTTYDTDEENMQGIHTQEQSEDATAATVSSKPVDLQSEWENFEKMLAGDGDDDAVAKSVEPITECSTAVGSGTVSLPQSEPQPASSPQPATEVNNPYAYLSYLTSDQSDGAAGGSDSAKEMERQLEEFLEKTAQAAADEASTQSQEGAADHSASPSHSEHSHDTDSNSEHSSRSRSPSHKKSLSKDRETKSADKRKSAEGDENRASLIKRLDEMNKPSKAGPSCSGTVRSRRSSGSPSRRRRSHRSHSRSRRSRSRSHSRRSRSRSRSRRHKRRSSRSRHGGSSRKRRRSGSRHRKRGHRSRSPRRRREGDRHRSSRHRRSRRRSGSRERRRDPNRKAQYAPVSQSAAPPKTEDFKARMKRELQQAAKDAMAGKGQATPQQALLQTMAAMHAKAQELTGVQVPKFYNPAAINPLKFAEQQQKRKLLWSKAPQNQERSLQAFQGTEVITDEKYRKLMGIKGEVDVTDASDEQKQRQNELFNKLDQEYMLARITTHTHRGAGLGVVTSMAAQSANEQFNRP